MREPFYCGTQRMDWMCRNCDRCTKFDPDTTPEDAPCDIDAALTRAEGGRKMMTTTCTLPWTVACCGDCPLTWCSWRRK